MWAPRSYELPRQPQREPMQVDRCISHVIPGRIGLALFLGLSLAACSWVVPGAGTTRETPRPGAPGGAFVALSGAPMKLPRLQPGQACPFSKESQVGPQLGAGLGGGPVYLFSGELVRSDPAHSNKVVWAADPSYSGPIRVRGGRIDASGQLSLGGPDNNWRGAPVKTVEGTGLYPELDFLESHSAFPNVPPGWRMWPSATYVITAGCYAWQVDGRGFTELITFHSLDLQRLPAGSPCPISPQQVANNLSSEFGLGPAVGSGPIYALMGEMQGGVLKYSQSYSQSHYKDGWAYSKVLWMAKPGVIGGVLVRGQQIDGAIEAAGWIGFGMGDVPDITLHWDVASQTGWASLPSEIRIRAPGCYAVQVDSQGKSEVIVFQVTGSP